MPGKSDLNREEDRLLSPNELAKRWSLSRTGVINIVERAGIPSVYLGGVARGSRRFRLSDILAYEDLVTAPAPQQASRPRRSS